MLVQGSEWILFFSDINSFSNSIEKATRRIHQAVWENSVLTSLVLVIRSDKTADIIEQQKVDDYRLHRMHAGKSTMDTSLLLAGPDIDL